MPPYISRHNLARFSVDTSPEPNLVMLLSFIC